MPAKVTFSPTDVADSAAEDTVVEDTVVEDAALEHTAGRAQTTVAEPVVDEPVAEPAVDKQSVVDEPAPDDQAVADEPAAEPAPVPAGPPPSPRPSRWVVLVAALSVLLVALWVAGAFLVMHDRGVSQLAAQRQEVLAAGQKVAGDLTSIGADNAPAQIQSLTSESIGAFRDQISTYAQALQTILQQSKAGSRGTVTAAGIEQMGPDTASVLVTVSATVSNSTVTAGQPVSYRLGVKLQREGDRWLASDVAFVQ